MEYTARTSFVVNHSSSVNRTKTFFSYARLRTNTVPVRLMPLCEEEDSDRDPSKTFSPAEEGGMRGMGQSPRSNWYFHPSSLLSPVIASLGFDGLPACTSMPMRRNGSSLPTPPDPLYHLTPPPPPPKSVSGSVSVSSCPEVRDAGLADLLNILIVSSPASWYGK